MKRLGLMLAVVVLAGAALTTASARTSGKTAICHRTTSKKTPYVKLKVSAKALRAHLKHAADIIPAPKGGCPRSVLTATTGGSAFQVAMTGEAEAPAGDPVATGTATVRFRAGQGQVCYQIAAENLPPAAAAHIHVGAAGTAGNVVIPLKTPDASGKSSGCAAATRPLVKAILSDPAGYYVNVHTADFPAGAIRGQLTGTSTASFGWIVAITLKGSTEPNATGTAVVRIRKDVSMACYRLHAANITLPSTASHIHRGAADVSGPVVIPFVPPDATGNSAGCTQTTPALVDEIIAQPGQLLRQRAHEGAPGRRNAGRSSADSELWGAFDAPPQPRSRDRRTGRDEAQYVPAVNAAWRFCGYAARSEYPLDGGLDGVHRLAHVRDLRDERDRARARTDLRLEQRVVPRSDVTEMLPAQGRDDATSRRALDEPELQEVRLVDVLDRVRLLAERDRERRQADRPAAEALRDRAQQLPVDALQPALVHLVQLQRLARDLDGDGALVPDFGDVADAAEDAVRDARRSA